MKDPAIPSVQQQRLPTLAADCLLGAALGSLSSLSWIAICVLFERREAWDTGAYFAVLLPLLWAASALAGWRRPLRPWRWPLAIVAGQMLGLAITTHSSPTLGPLPLIAFALLGAPCFVAANMAAGRARQR